MKALISLTLPRFERCWLTAVSAAGLLVSVSTTNAPAQSGCTPSWGQNATAAPTARERFAMCYDTDRNKVVVFGGLSASGGSSTFFGDVWEYAGGAWSQVSPAAPSGAPGPRADCSMVYDTTLHRAVLFGGLAATGYVQDTWALSASGWSPIGLGTPPSARGQYAAAYDAAHSRVVLFGGRNSSGSLRDTWGLDGSTWSLRLIAGGPTARTDAAMTFDSAAGVCQLFGGSVNGNSSRETWTYNGTAWTMVANDGPSARSGAAMAYVPGQGCVLFGGIASGAPANDTWQRVNAMWSSVSSGTSPPLPDARQQAGLAWNSSAQRLVLFGGAGLSGGATVNLSDTWEMAWTGGVSFQENPSSSTACPGSSASFHVTPAGSGPFTYQWRKGGTPLSDGSQIAGAATAMLTISGVAPAHAGQYDCVATATGGCGSAASNVATLSFCAANFNCQGGVTVQDIFDFLAAWFNHDPKSDVNGLGGISVQDIFDFLNSWFARC